MGLEQLPWEQKHDDPSLQVNSYVGDVEDTSDTKEQIQTELDVKISKMKTSIVKDSKYEKPINIESQKNDNSKLDIFDEIGESNMLDKKKTIESNNQHLNETILSPKISEDERVFLDISIPDIVTNDEQLNTRKEKKNFLTPDNNIKMKRSSKDLEKFNLNINNIPNKKSKTFNDLNKIKNNNENLIDEKVSTIDRNTKLSYSRSPSLFDDSLNLDTQICDLLEQNVMDIAHLELDSKMFASDLDLITNTLQKKIASPDIGNAHLQGENETKNVNTALVQMRNSVLSWDDDSWNNSERLLKQIVQADSNQNNKQETSKPKIISIVNTNVSIASKNIKTCTPKSKGSLNKTDIKKRTALIKEKVPVIKPKLPKIESPITNIIVYRNERRMSAESNKSDSDDIIIGSQHFDSPFNDSKTRTRIKLEKIRKMRSQKLAEDTITEINNRLNSPIRAESSDMSRNKTKQKAKPKLKEILERNLYLGANCSTDSIIYNSEDETLKSDQSKTKLIETQSNVSNKNVKSKIEVALLNEKKNLSSETIDWNILNVVKIANNRATFNLFKREVLKKQNIALALHCDIFMDNTNNIGSKICASDAEGKRKYRKSGSHTHGNMEVRGVAISWESNIAYYISFSNSPGNRNM